MISHDPNPSMEHGSSHSYHDEDEALRLPPEQVDYLATEIDKNARLAFTRKSQH